MIQEVGNIELFELLETDPKTQCTACLLYWNVRIVYFACGHFLQKETEANRNFVKYTMDFLSLPEYVIKKGRPHVHRCGKKPGDKEYYLANQLKKKCKKRQPPRCWRLFGGYSYGDPFRTWSEAGWLECQEPTTSWRTVDVWYFWTSLSALVAIRQSYQRRNVANKNSAREKHGGFFGLCRA